MNGFLKHIANSIAFLSGLFILLILSSFLMIPKNNTREAGMREPRANAILTEPENTIDILYLGDSESQSSIIPKRLWEKRGFTLYSCGTSGQRLCDSLEYLYKAFRKQNPKLVVLETNCIFTRFSEDDAILSRAGRMLPVISYHNRWKTLNQDDLKFRLQYKYMLPDKGYKASNIMTAASTDGYMKPTDQKESIPRLNLWYLKRIRAYCKSRNVRFMLLSIPSTINWNMKKHNRVKQLAADQGIEYMDMNLMPEQVPIDWSKDTRDKGDHLNDVGAGKVTDYMGEYFSTLELFTSHHGERKYAHWN